MRRTHVITGLCVVLVLVCSGLLLSAVQRAREAAARSKCQGNMKQLALAVYGWHDTQGPFAGTILLTDVPAERRLSWLVALLPYVERSEAFKQFDTSLPADAAVNRTAVTAHPLGLLVCPSAVAPWRAAPGPVTHYVGTAGVGADAAELPAKDQRAGAFGYDRKTYLDSSVFTDGRSTTILLAETAMGLGDWSRGGRGTVRPLVPEEAPHLGPGRPFGGLHAGAGWVSGPSCGVMNVAMADGSVRTIRGDIDPVVLEALATLSGREELPAEW